MDRLPLSAAQREIWSAVRLDPGNPMLNLGNWLDIRGPIDVAVLESALRLAVTEADALRLAVLDDPIEPSQAIQPLGAWSLPVVDLRAAGEPEAAARDWCDADLLRPFDLAEFPLFRFALLRLSEYRHILYECVHHILWDGFSWRLYYPRLADVYTALVNGDTPGESPFASVRMLLDNEFAHAESAAFAREREFWVGRRALPPEPVSLAARPPTRARDRLRSRHAVPDDVAEALRAAAWRERVAWPAALVAAMAAYLSRRTGRRDVLLTFPVSGRQDRTARSIPGLRANLVPLFLPVRPDSTCVELLRAAAGEIRLAVDHSTVPGREIRRALGFAGDDLRPFGPSVNILPEVPPLRLGPCTATVEVLANGVVDDLQLTVRDGTQLYLDANPELYRPDELTAVRDGFLRFLAVFASAPPDEPVARLPLLDAVERAGLLADARGADRPEPAEGIADRFHRAVARHPSTVAVTDATESISYAELARRAGAVARHLSADPGPVGVQLEPGVGLVATALGVLLAGCTYVPLDPRAPRAHTASLLSRNGIRRVVTSEPPSGEPVGHVRVPRPDEVAYVVFTSGSTGRPKGVMVTHGGLLNHLTAKIEELALSGSDVVAMSAPPTFDISIWQLLAPLLVGGRVHVTGRDLAADAVALFERVATAGITVLEVVPSLLRAALDAWLVLDAVPDLGALRWLVVTGEELPTDLCDRWFARFPGVGMVNAYGPTECSDRVTHAVLSPAGHGVDGGVPIGLPIRNTRCHVLDEALQPARSGELYVGGSGVARGYLGEPASTAERFVADPFDGQPGARMYRTGDRVRRLPDARLVFLGRRDDQVKIRGHRVELGAVEAALREIPGVVDAATRVHTDGSGHSRLVGYVVGEVDVTGVRTAAADVLPDSRLLASVVALDAIPLTARGKVDRAALPPPRPTRTAAAPRNARDASLAGLFAAVLGLDRVGVQDSFFELGGDSILAIQLSARCAAAGMAISPQDVFQHKTVAALAAATVDRAPPQSADVAPDDRATSTLPLSPLQEGLLFHALHDRTAPDVYRTQTSLDLDGRVDADAVRAAVRAVLRAHPHLRAGFEHDPRDGPLAVIPAEADPPWREVDLSDRPEQALRVAEIERADFDAEFDLTRPPLLRGTLVRLGAERARLVLTNHHILLDGWSLPRLVVEIFRHYGSPARYSPAAGYRDYLMWTSRQDVTAAAAAWRRALAGLPWASLVAPAGSRPDDTMPERIVTALSAESTADLLAATRRRGLTVNTVVHGCWAMLLARLTASRDVVFGTTVALRPPEIPGVDAVLGLLANTTPVRLRLDPAEPWDVMLARLQAQQADLLPHQHLSLARIQQLAGLNPLFDTLVVTENFRIDEVRDLAAAGMRLRAATVRSATHYSLCVAVFPGPELRVEVAYRTGMVDRRVAEYAADRLLALLRAFPAEPDRPVARVDVPAPAAGGEVPRAAGTAAAPTVPDLFAAQVASTPDATAVTFMDQALSYAEVDARASRLARVLAGRGAGPEQVVAVVLPRSPELVVAVLAVLMTGAAFLIVDPAGPPERVRTVLAEARPRVVLTESTMDEPAPVAQRVPVPRVHRLNAAYVVYTSGSTGRPKGIVMPVGGLVNLLVWHRDEFAGTGTRTAQFLSTAFDFVIQEMLQALVSGKTLVLTPDEVRGDFAALAAWLDRHQVHELFAPAPVIDAVFESSDRGPRSLTDVFQGGEAFPLGSTLGEHCRRRPELRLHNIYGPAETHAASAATLPADVALWPRSAPLGRPVRNATLHVLDPFLRPVPPGATGELYVGGAQVARGYLGQPGHTAARFVADPFGPAGGRLYRTGDLVRVSPTGELDFAGRSDHQVKVRGMRVEPGEVESVLSQDPSVAGVAVVASGEGGATRLTAYVVPSAGHQVRPAELRARLAPRLPSYQIPSGYVVLDELPLTPNGKVDRRALRESPVATAPAGRAPRTRREAVLCGLFAETLALDHVAPEANFFELGGHSMSATRLLGAIRVTFDVDLSVNTLFAFPTPTELAGRLDGGGQDSFDSLISLKPTGGRAPLFCVHPAGGYAWPYARLTPYLGLDRPIYGLQIAGIDTEPVLAGDIESMAASYVSRIVHAWPDGPYHLLGWSFGGTVAHEVAVQLQRAGRPVGALIMLDTARQFPGPVPDPREVMVRLLLDAGCPLAELPRPPVTPTEVAELLRARDLPFDRRQVDNVIAVYRNNIALLKAFTPHTFHGRLTYVVATVDRVDDNREATDWSPYVAGVVDYHDVHSGHHHLMEPGPLSRYGPALGAVLR